MRVPELEEKVQQLRELKAMQAEIDAEIESIQDEIKLLMDGFHEYELTGPSFKVTWKESSRTVFDSKRFKNDHPDLAEQYNKVSTYRTFKLT